MKLTISFLSLIAFTSTLVKADSSSENFSLKKLPKTWQANQAGTNDCDKWGKSSQNSTCQNAFINSIDDFCLFAPPTAGPKSLIADTERIEVSWCTKAGYGTRLIPEGTITSAQFLRTDTFVQIIGKGDMTKINVFPKDEGGELDPHGADGLGNPIGGLVFSNGFQGGEYSQSHEWMEFMAFDSFCFRACKSTDQNSQEMCQHVYDVMGCNWVMPSDFYTETKEIFESCSGDDPITPPGIYIENGSSSTFWQGQSPTPSAAAPAKSSHCKQVKSIIGGDTKNGIKGKHLKQTTAPAYSSATSTSQSSVAKATGKTQASAVAQNHINNNVAAGNSVTSTTSGAVGGLLVSGMALSMTLLSALVLL